MYKLMITLGFFLASAGAFAAGDAKQGEALTATCLACHGSDGNSLAGSFPNIQVKMRLICISNWLIFKQARVALC